MAHNRNFSRRETRQAAAVLPLVEDLGARLTMPRKTNRAAARTVASGDRFWDKRKVDRKARKRALATHEARASHPLPHRLSRKQKQWITAHLPQWSWDTSADALTAPAPVTDGQLDELVRATHLPYVRRALLKLQGLDRAQAEYVAARAPRTASIVLVDPQVNGWQAIRVPFPG